MTTRALITGGTGFIGLHLTRKLLADGYELTLIDNGFRSTRDREVEALIGAGVTVLDLDLTEASALQNLRESFDEVYHLAAIVGVRYATERPAEVLRTNILSTVTLLDWLRARGTGRLVFSSTSEVYAASVDRGLAPVPTPERVLLSIGEGLVPRYSYGLSKIVGEFLVRESAARDGYQHTIVRFHNVYGPRMGFDHVIPQVLERIRRREAPFSIYGADQRRAFCYVEDAVSYLRALSRSPSAEGLVVNIGNDTEEIAIGDLTHRLFDMTGYNAETRERDAPDGSVHRRCPDLRLLRDLLGELRHTPLQTGLAATVAWYQEHGAPRE